MNPIDVTGRLKNVLISYLLTTFDVNRDGENAELYSALRDAFETDNALLTGPFLELSLPHARGDSIQTLVDKKILSPRFLTLVHPPIPIDAPLYQHQQQATERIVAGHSVIVSSGTGSGKTEAFLIPILNDLLQSPSRGVRAVLIYPLNALVNDQLDRLRKHLTGTGITFGRYTSELPNTTAEALKALGKSQNDTNEVISRQEIRDDKKIPNILITNYAMLEYLLMRPNDSGLFQHAEDWKYIVLDEAHSYSGAKGIEVAYLVRRLKQRLDKSQGDMCCIGTSATLTEDENEAITFAHTLFGETFTANDIIFGKTVDTIEDEIETILPPMDAYLKEGWDDLLAKLRANTATLEEVWDSLLDFKLIDDNATIDPESIEALLYGALKNNAHLRQLRTKMVQNKDVPLGLTEVTGDLFPESQADPVQKQDALRALHHLVELGARARPHNDYDQLPLLPARYHVFARSPQGIWVCLNPTCEGRPENHTAKWSVVFGEPRLVCKFCDCAVYPLSICRACGQVYVKTIFSGEQHWAEPQKDMDEKIRYFVWSQAEINAALADDDEEQEAESEGRLSGNKTQIAKTSTELCLNPECRRESRCTCAKSGRKPHPVRLYQVVTQASKGNLGTRSQAVSELQCCVRCGTESRIKGEEIATPINIRGTTPLSVLTMELYRQLPESSVPEIQRKAGGGRKLLSFYDSRQGAARYAAFLQDVFSQDLYRYLIPQTIIALRKETTSIDLMDLAEKGTRMGWDDLHVFQTAVDEEIDEIFEQQEDRYKSWNSLATPQQRRFKNFTLAQMLAEITTNRKGRQSLESLGMLTVRYFETPPDLAALAAQIGLNSDQTRTLIEYLLETLRTEKALNLPDGISRKHSAFGRHEGNAAIVRGNPQNGEARWVGATERHTRCRIMALALKAAGRPNDLEAVKRALLTIWDWLIDPELGLMIGDERTGYRLSYSHLFFDTPEEGWQRCTKCQRLRHGQVALPCPSARCEGKYEPIDAGIQQVKNYYHYIFKQGLKPMRVEEHTAQLDPKKGQEYQRRFKDGDINVLSCSTTFEMGIDLGDLQAVVMNNVPPNVSNYRQRAGRAGRRAGGTAFIVTWANARPHDQIYYTTPPDIIRGQVRIPRLTLKNTEIQRRHLNALLLSDFLHYLHRQGASELDKVGAFFDPQAMNGRHYDHLEVWKTSSGLMLTRKLGHFASMIEQSDLTFERVMSNFEYDLAQAEEHYRTSLSFYRQAIENAKSRYQTEVGKEEYWEKQRKNTERLLASLNRDELINTLSGRGVLPSYSFPLYTVELELPIEKQASAKLRLQRDLRRAITEFAPGAEVVADKRLWVSNGVRVLRDTLRVFEYRLCETCNHIEAEDTPGKPLLISNCPVCETVYTGSSATARYLVPDGFRTDPEKSGKMAGQYVRYENLEQRIAVFIPSIKGEIVSADFASRRVETSAKLFFLNTGTNGMGYKLCQKCGLHITHKNDQCPNKSCGGTGEKFHLGHAVPTDTLLIQFNPPSHVPMPGKLNLTFWHTLQTALVLGATRALQIERDDIGGTLFPIHQGREWQRSLVLYDNVPGGAGYMNDIHQHFPKVIEAALSLVRCPYCSEDISCTRCLRDYGNQKLYPFLKRGEVIRFLENLYANLTEENNADGILNLIANNRAEILWDAISSAKRSLRLAVSHVEDFIPIGKTSSWLDLISDRLRAGVEVKLLMTDPPNLSHNPDDLDLVTANFLAVMMSRSQQLDLRQTDTLPEWHAIIDTEDPSRNRAIQFAEDIPQLGAALKNPSLRTTTQENGVKKAIVAFESYFGRAQRVTAEDLQAPPKTQVVRIASSRRKSSEVDIPALVEFFRKPVAKMSVFDPYLLDYDRIVNRLGAYIQMAADQGALTTVEVTTRDAKLEDKDSHQQKRSFEVLKNRFPTVKIMEKRLTNREEHDRWIKVVRADDTKAEMSMGRGLDFIRSDGTVQATYLVIEEMS